MNLTNCEYDDCPMPKVAVDAKHMLTCTCGCEKTMHKNCVIAHNRKITHMLQTNREVKQWH